jgi:serine/threonine protein kinase
MRETVAGVIMGTAAYMSPEQARGIAADERSDIWSFGVVLYEMLTGRHLFRGETVSDTLAGVLKTNPDWKALPPDTPASIRRLLRRCLERDRNRRLPDIGVALLEIDDAQAEPEAPAGIWIIARSLRSSVARTETES